MYRADTIAARATPAGRAAIAVVRLSGLQVSDILARVFRPTRERALRPWRLAHGTVVDPVSRAPVDEALAVFMPRPRSYTGEDAAELQVHGSPVVVERVLDCLMRAGARAAEPGEFTRRAVLNGRLDLLQAEAVADLIDARVEAGACAAWEQLQGALSGRLEALRARVVAVLAEVEAAVDFSDEDPQTTGDAALSGEVGTLCRQAREMLAGFAASRRLRDGFRTVFVGRPNVGKSSLVNALLGCGRMLVSDEPGTTRDTVEESVDLGGAAFVLIDTAGLRTSSSKAENAAVERARRTASEADIVVWVVDGSLPLHTEDRAVLEEVEGLGERIVVINKCDLPRRVRAADLAGLHQPGVPIVACSALTGGGCRQLASALEAIAAAGREQAGSASISRPRHRSALEKAAAALERAADMLAASRPPELVSVELRDAVACLAGLVAPLDNEEVLDRIFREFCIGK